MERRFTSDEFEQFLKQEADNFKMIPSKKIWHGIYNDIHPGRRWPSITVSLLLISTLVFIGHMNTPKMPNSGNSHKGSMTSNAVQITTSAGTNSNGQKDLINTGTSKLLSENRPIDLTVGKSDKSKTIIGQSVIDKEYKPIAQIRLSRINIPKTNGDEIAQVNSNTLVIQTNLPTQAFPNPEISQTIIQAETANGDFRENGSIKEKILTDKQVSITPENKTLITNKDLSDLKPAAKNETTVTAENNADRASANKKLQSNVNDQRPKGISKRKRNDKISYTYFVGPSVTNVSFHGAPISPSVFLSTSVSIMPSNYKVLNHVAFGFEAGAQINYAFASKWKFATGLHLTYSGYNIRSNEMHPTVATLILRDPDSHVDYSKQYFSHYGDGTGLTQVSIKNHSLQASLPVGLQYQFFTGDKVQLNTSADIEPSIVLNNYAYVLSSDGRNYVNDPSLVRKANIASNFGIFLSFGSKKFSWQIGPVVRYQWFSTYKRDYTISEHLLNYGIRIGISPFRK